MLADANPEDVDSFGSLESALAEQLDMDTEADDNNNRPWAPTGTNTLSLPSGQALSYGPAATNVMAAQYNSDFSVTSVGRIQRSKICYYQPGPQSSGGRRAG